MSVVDLEKRTRTPAGDVAAPDPVASPAKPRRAGRILRFLAFGIVVLAGLAFLGQWLMNRWAHVHVVDSRIAANVVTVSSEVEGRVTALPVIAGDQVAPGDLLVGLDTRKADLKLRELDAEFARLDAERSQLQAQQDMIRARIASQLEAAGAKITAAEAAKRVAEADVALARSSYERATSLHQREIVSEQRFEETRARFVTAEQQTLRAAADVESARADRAVTEAERAQITVLDRQIAVLDAQKAAIVARRDQQRVDLEDRKIQGAFDGVIDQTFVDVGEYVSPGKRLLMYHDPGEVWVDINVKETEFRRLRIGAEATIAVDAYPDRTFKGSVARLGGAATSQFALLPSPNPSGNFTKVTQRLPVRIAIEQIEGLLRPGMMVEVTIDAVD